MKLVITIETENAAFNFDEIGPETARILHDLANRLARMDRTTLVHSTPIGLRDVNGNRVGQLTDED